MQFYPAIVIVNRMGYNERVKAEKRTQEGIEFDHHWQNFRNLSTVLNHWKRPVIFSFCTLFSVAVY